MRQITGAILAAITMIAASSAKAHTAWLVPEGAANSWLLRFGGRDGKLNPTVPEKLKWIRA